jgi:hypothetical protein
VISPSAASLAILAGGPGARDRPLDANVAGAPFPRDPVGELDGDEDSHSDEHAHAGTAVGPVGLADTLGWASAVLGAPMTLTPRRLLRAIGVQDDRRAVAWTIGVGLREHLATLNIIANRQRRIGMWSRVAGDTMDLALLAGAYRKRRVHGGRMQAAIGVVSGLLVVDLATAMALTRADGSLVPDGSESAGAGADHGAGTGPTRVRPPRRSEARRTTCERRSKPSCGRASTRTRCV